MTSTAHQPTTASPSRADRLGGSDVPAGRARLSKAVLAQVVLLTMIAPLATDLYVPAFPVVGRSLHTGATEIQLTLTTFFVGMALGQLIGGPISDQRGRRGPLLGALLAMALASLLCALSPTISILMIARVVQGFSGGWAMVIARSVVVDLASGPRLVPSLNLVQGVAGIAPIVGPLLGAAILQLSHWRVSFWLLAVWGAAMLIAVALGVPESLPVERRQDGGLRQLRGAAGQVLRVRGFVGYLIVMAFSMGVTFAYVATSAFVLQSLNGLSPVLYSLDFAANAVGLTLATLAAARLAASVPTRLVIGVGLTATVAAGTLLLVGALWFAMPLWAAVAGFFVVITAQGLIGPNAGALASGEVPERSGTGSAILGFLQWCTAGVIAPIAGVGGGRTAVPMPVVILALAAASFAALRLAKPTDAHARTESADAAALD